MPEQKKENVFEKLFYQRLVETGLLEDWKIFMSINPKGDYNDFLQALKFHKLKVDQTIEKWNDSNIGTEIFKVFGDEKKSPKRQMKISTAVAFSGWMRDQFKVKE